jgi:signal peptidase II
MLPLALLLLGLDQWSKGWAVANVAGQPPRTYWGIFTLIYAENMGAGWGPQTRWLVLGVLPALVLFGLAVYALKDPEVTSWEVTACALVVAGGAGNLIDRFRLGYVQDFLYMGYGPIGTNIFNVADAVVMLGLGTLLLKNLQSYLASPKPAP